MKRLTLIELHKSGLKRSMMKQIKGGEDIRCLCTFTNPLVSTRESGGTVPLCVCADGPISKGIQHRPPSY